MDLHAHDNKPENKTGFRFSLSLSRQIEECIHHHALAYPDRPQEAGMRTPADGFTPYSGTQSARGPRQAYEQASQATNPMRPAKHMYRFAPMITQIQEK